MAKAIDEMREKIMGFRLGHRCCRALGRIACGAVFRHHLRAPQEPLLPLRKQRSRSGGEYLLSFGAAARPTYPNRHGSWTVVALRRLALWQSNQLRRSLVFPVLLVKCLCSDGNEFSVPTR